MESWPWIPCSQVGPFPSKPSAMEVQKKRKRGEEHEEEEEKNKSSFKI